jgi:hypothetical protein
MSFRRCLPYLQEQDEYDDDFIDDTELTGMLLSPHSLASLTGG